MDRARRARASESWVLVLAAAALWAGPAAAEPDRLIDPAEARALRELRSLDSRLPRDSSGARIQLERSRREIDRPGNGIDYLPEGARLGRELDRIERERDRPSPAPAPAVRAARPGGELPSSYGGADGLPRSYDGDGGGTAPGGSNNLVATARLLDRAERALTQGRPRQARSNIAAAQSFLDDVAAAPPVAARRAALADRLKALERRTTDAEDR